MEEIKSKLPEGWAEDKEVVELPEGWRPLDYRIFKKLAIIEAQIFKLFERDKLTTGLMISGEKLRKIQDEHIEILYRDREKLTEVYYQVFPERLAQDLKILKQLDAIKSKAGPDSNPEKA